MDNVIEIPAINTEKADTAFTEATEVLNSAKGVIIKTPEQAQRAGDWRNRIKTKLKELDDDRKELTRPLDEIKKKIMDKYRPAVERLEEAYRIFDRGLSGYLAEQERIRQEQQRKLDEEARKKREAAEAKAAEWAEKGNEKKAEEWAEKAETVIAPVVATPPKVEGITTRDDWEIEITNTNAIPREWLVPDVQAISKFVKSTKGMKQIPGVKIIPKKVIVKSR
ncbi:MAG: hypothetical protein PHE61_08605 [Candidatus Omnitrophica bacterium]|nr:hypothetical protein [Candidatus Omnitrophota bacterium]